MSREIAYALIVRDAAGKRLAVVGTGREPSTKHHKMTPTFHHLCTSLLDLVHEGEYIEVVKWEKGVQVEQAPVFLVASRMEKAGWLAYHWEEPENGPRTAKPVEERDMTCE